MVWLFGQTTLNTTGGTPPVTTTCWLYCPPFDPLTRVVVVNVGGRTTLIIVVTVTPELAFATASKLTVRAIELFVGAVYVTEVFVMLVNVPQPVPAQPVPVSGFQVTPFMPVSLPRMAVNCITWP